MSTTYILGQPTLRTSRSRHVRGFRSPPLFLPDSSTRESRTMNACTRGTRRTGPPSSVAPTFWSVVHRRPPSAPGQTPASGGRRRGRRRRVSPTGTPLRRSRRGDSSVRVDRGPRGRSQRVTAPVGRRGRGPPRPGTGRPSRPAVRHSGRAVPRRSSRVHRRYPGGPTTTA